MKRAAVLFCLMFFSGVTFAAQASPGEALFLEAVKKYQAGDFAGAAVLNERVLKEAREESPAVYFNLGNSYFRQGRLGKAVLNYLQSQRLAPRDADVLANLAFARAAVEQYESARVTEKLDLWRRPFRHVSSEEFKWLALWVFIIGTAVCLGGLYGGWPPKRVLLCLVLTGSAAVYVSAAFVVRLVDMSGQAVAVAKADARFEPSGGATVYFKIPEGAEVRVLRQKEGWLKVQRQDGRVGWVPEKAVESL